MFVEKDVSERILSLYDAEDLELCEAYAVDAHLGENLPEFTTVYRAEPEHFCFVINPDRIGRNYFKLYNHRFPVVFLEERYQPSAGSEAILPTLTQSFFLRAAEKRQFCKTLCLTRYKKCVIINTIIFVCRKRKFLQW